MKTEKQRYNHYQTIPICICIRICTRIAHMYVPNKKQQTHANSLLLLKSEYKRCALVSYRTIRSIHDEAANIIKYLLTLSHSHTQTKKECNRIGHTALQLFYTYIDFLCLEFFSSSFLQFGSPVLLLLFSVYVCLCYFGSHRIDSPN